MLANYQVDAILSPHRTKLLDIVATAVNNYHSDDSPLKVNHSRRTRASAIHDEMVAEARRIFANVPGISIVSKRGMFLVYIDNQIAIRFKKLTRQLLAQNQPTQQVIDFNNQLKLGQQFGPMAGTPDPMTHVNVGYQSNTLGTGVNGIYAVCPSGETIAWAIDLLHSGGGLGRSIAATIGSAPEPGPGVILRSKKGAKNGAESKAKGGGTRKGI